MRVMLPPFRFTKTPRVALARVFVFVCLSVASVAFTQHAYASVPAIANSALFQNHPDDNTAAISWCGGVDTGTTTLFTTETTDANGFKYATFYNRDVGSSVDGDIYFDDSDHCHADYQNANYQLSKGVPDSSQGNWVLQYIYKGTTGDTMEPASGDVYWKDATGATNRLKTGSYLERQITFGGINYVVVSVPYTLKNNAPNLGAGGYIDRIDDISASDAPSIYWLQYTQASSTADLYQILNAADLNSFLEAANGVDWSGGGESIPASSVDYIVITEPDNGDNVSYTVPISGQLNLANAATGTKSYRITFTSQTGIDYTSKTIENTTTQYSEYQFSESVEFTMDDIVYVSAYLYDCSTPGNCTPSAVKLQSYEWWVSANGNPTELVDLGIFRTGVDVCADYSSSSTWSVGGFTYAMCHVGRFLFVPSETSLNLISSQVSTATGTAPFSYIYDVRLYTDQLFTPASTTWDITLPSSTPIFGDMTLLQSSDIDADSNYQLVRTFMTTILYLSLVFYIYKRVKRLGSNL